MSTRRLPMALLVLGFLALSWFVFGRVAQRGRFTGEFSTYGSGPLGTRALYLLAAQLGAHPARHAQDLAALPQPGMLVALGGCETTLERPVSRYEGEELEHWLAAGGVLVVAGTRDYLPDTLGVHLDRNGDSCKRAFSLWSKRARNHDTAQPPLPLPSTAPDAGGLDAGPSVDAGSADSGTRVIHGTLPSPSLPVSSAGPSATRWAVAASDLLRGLAVMPMEQPGRIRLDTHQEHELLLRTLTGRDRPEDVLGVAVPHGHGTLIVLASASMFQNRTLRESEGAPLFMRLVRRYAPHGPVLFDEYHGGVGERRSVMQYLRQAGVMPAVFALFVCVGLWLARAGARFGAVRRDRAKAPRGSASFVAAMGQLYSGSRDQDGAVDAIVRRALARVARHHHLPVSSADRLARVLTDRGTHVAAEAVQELASLQRTAHSEPGKLPALIARIDLVLARALV